jgi:hypothetical protein
MQPTPESRKGAFSMSDLQKGELLTIVAPGVPIRVLRISYLGANLPDSVQSFAAQWVQLPLLAHSAIDLRTSELVVRR